MFMILGTCVTCANLARTKILVFFVIVIVDDVAGFVSAKTLCVASADCIVQVKLEIEPSIRPPLQFESIECLNILIYDRRKNPKLTSQLIWSTASRHPRNNANFLQFT